MLRMKSAVLFVVAFGHLSLSIGSANASDDDELRRLAARAFAGCFDAAGARILAAKRMTKPTSFESAAAIQCKEHEDRLRTVLNLDMLQAQVKRQKILNKDAQRVVTETIEQAITDIRRTMVILYATAFDKQYPGVRSCLMADEAASNDKMKYFCAVRD